MSLLTDAYVSKDREKWKLWDKADLKLKSLVPFHLLETPN